MALLAATLVLAAALGAGEPAEPPPTASASTPPVPRDPTGRRLYLLIVDALALTDLPRLPALAALGDGGFVATVQPCVDNFTTSCVREALTGRRHGSLFSMFENFTSVGSGPGANLFGDAEAAGMRTALLSAGNLRAWNRIAGADLRVDAPGAPPEGDLALDAAARFDLVVHHWIWLDVASHHAQSRLDAYRDAQADTNALIARLAAGLPADMDLLVTGDHGHAPDGRHLEGLDTPTHVVLRSPNVLPVRPPDRIPITAIRTLAGAVTGVPSSGGPPAVGSAGWLRNPPPASPPSAVDPAEDTPSVRTLAIAVTLLGVWAFAAAGARSAGPLLLWSALLGVGFQAWIERTSQRSHADDFLAWCWIVPVVVGAGAWGLRRRADALVLGTTFGALALLLGVWPGLAPFSVLRLLPEILSPALAALVVVALAPDGWRGLRGWVPALVVSLVILCLPTLLQFDTNPFRIRAYPLDALVSTPWRGTAAGIALGAAAGGMGGRWRSALAGGIAVAVGPLLPTSVQALVMASLVVALVTGRAMAAFILALITLAFTLPLQNQFGVLAIVVAAGLALRVIEVLGRRDPALAAGTRWTAALLIVGVGYAGLAFTMGLTVGGLDFDFALPWFPDRWHVRLWWLVVLATLVKMFLPLILVDRVGRVSLGDAGFRDVLDRAARLAGLRSVASAWFLASWLVTSQTSLASSRFRVLVFDGFAWMFMALALGALMGRRRDAPAPTA